MSDPGAIDPTHLTRFTPFEGLPEHDLLLLISQIEARSVPARHNLFAVGDRDEWEYLLLTGEVEFTAADGTRRRLAADSEQARRPLARLRPRQYTAVTTQPCQLLVVPLSLLKAIQDQGDAMVSMAGYVVDEVDSIEEAQELELLADFRIALDNQYFVLPSLPEIALKVCEMINNEDADINKISTLVNSDQAIAAKLIRAANSPIFRGASQCETTRNAIVRLGMKTTHQLVVSFALKDLFHSKSAVLKRVMQQTWRESIEVAAISLVVAQKAKGLAFDPEEAMLAGLLHNIGVVAALSYLDATRPEVFDEPEQLQEILENLKARAGEAILHKWRFPNAFVTAALHAEDWFREHDEPADLCDLVQVAKLHALLRGHRPLPVSHLDEAPALSRLMQDEVGPRLTIQILEESKEQIKQAQALLDQ